jgi:hypothetical protein
MKITVLEPAPQKQWEGDIMITDQDRNNDSSVSSNVEVSSDELVQDEPIHMRPRISKRQKGPPIIKSDDFLWSR